MRQFSLLAQDDPPVGQKTEKSSAPRKSRAEAQPAQRTISDSEIFWVTAAATAYSLEAFRLGGGGEAQAAPNGVDEEDEAALVIGAATVASNEEFGRKDESETGAPGDLAEESESLGQIASPKAVASAESEPEAGPAFELSGVGPGEDFSAVGGAMAAILSSGGGVETGGVGDVYWRQTEAVISEGHAVEIVGVDGNVVFEGLADMIGFGGAALKIEATGSIDVTSDAALAGDDAAVEVTSVGDGDIDIEFIGSATAGAAVASLDSTLDALEERFEAVEEALSELELSAVEETASLRDESVLEEAAEETAPDAEPKAETDSPIAIEAAADSGVSAQDEEQGLSIEADSDGAEISIADETVAVLTGAPSLGASGQTYLKELADAVEQAVDAVVDSFDFAPDYVDGAIGQLTNASAVGLLANTNQGGVNVIADGVVLASGDAVSLSSEEGAVAAEIDGLLVSGETAFVAKGDRITATLDGAAIGAETGVSIEAKSEADVDLEGVVRSAEGAAVRVASEGDVDLRVDGEVYSAGGVGLQIDAARDAKVRIDGVVEGGLALTGVTDGARLFGGGRYEIDIRGEITGGRAAESGSAAAISVEESFGANVRLTVVGDAWVEAGFVGMERDAAIRLGAGSDIIEIEGNVVGDVRLGAGDDFMRLKDEGVVIGGIDGGRGSDVFEAGDLADVFVMTFGSGSDTVRGFGFGDFFDFRALAEYNADGAAAMLETHFWDEGDDVATLSYFDGVEDVELTVYGDDLETIDFDDVFMWA